MLLLLLLGVQALEQRNRGISNAWRYVQANKGRFRMPVYGPILLEVDCPDALHLRCLEQQVAGEVDWRIGGALCLAGGGGGVVDQQGEAVLLWGSNHTWNPIEGAS